MSASALEPLAREAIRRFELKIDPSVLAEFVAGHQNNPPRENDPLFRAYHRVSAAWHLARDREDYRQALVIGAPWKGVEIDTRHSCQSAHLTFDGSAWTEARALPSLPLAGCEKPWCQCMYRGRTARQKRLDGM